MAGAGDILNPSNSLGPWASGGSNMINSGVQQGGSNQWMTYPALPNFNPSGGGGTFGTPMGTPPSSHAPTGTTPGGSPYVGHGYYESPTYDPAFTGSFYQMLQQLMSGGGGNLQNQLLSFLSGGPSSIPGANQLTEMGQTGDPISAMPEWKAMLDAQQQNIQQNQAGLKEQFAFAGDLQSSPFGTAMSNYMQQTSKDQNALLAQMDTQAMEAAMQRKLAADTSLTGMAGAETQFLDQLFSQGAFASPNLFKKSSSSILGGIGSLISAGAGGASAGLAASAGGASDIGAILAGLAAV